MHYAGYFCGLNRLAADQTVCRLMYDATNIYEREGDIFRVRCALNAFDWLVMAG